MAPKTLVVPLDGSEVAERALSVAEALAERLGGSLLLVSAQFYGPLEPQEYLEECALPFQRAAVEVLATKQSHIAETVLDAIAGDESRVVCMTTHGRGRVRWAALGSVAEDLVRRAGRPMLLVGRHCRPDFLTRSTHLLACSDGSDGSDGCGDLGGAARAWSDLLGLDTRVVVVTHPLDVESTEHPEVLLGEIAAPFGGSDRVTATQIHGRYVAGALADYAEELPAAIVAMNCHGRGGIARVTMGSVTMGVVQLAPCPVLVTHHAEETHPRQQTGTAS
jgi:nucleotide-binding universal stress UspA family protein